MVNQKKSLITLLILIATIIITLHSVFASLISDDLPSGWSTDSDSYNYTCTFEDSCSWINTSGFDYSPSDIANASTSNWNGANITTSTSILGVGTTACIKWRNKRGEVWQLQIANETNWAWSGYSYFRVYYESSGNLIEWYNTSDVPMKGKAVVGADIKDWIIDCFYYNGTVGNSVHESNFTSEVNDANASLKADNPMYLMARIYSEWTDIDWALVYNGYTAPVQSPTADDYKFQKCNSTTNTSTLNITFFDENNGLAIAADVDITFSYSITNYSGVTPYTYNGDDQYNYTFCIDPDNITVPINYTIYYSATDYPQKSYIANDAILTKSLTTLKLYLLSNTVGYYVRFRTEDAYGTSISGVEVTMQKLIGSTYVTVEEQLSDDSGLTTFFVDPDITYNFIFTKSGYSTKNYNLRPTSSEIYTIQMSTLSTIIISDYSNLTYYFQPHGENLLKNFTYDFNFTLFSDYWNVSSCTFRIYNYSNELLASAIPTVTNRICNATINFDTGNQTSLYTEAVWKINSGNNGSSKEYYKTSTAYRGSSSLINFFDDLKNFKGAGFDEFTLKLIGFVAILVTLAVLGINYINLTPESSVVIIIIMTWLFCYVGWFTIDYPLFPFKFFEKWIVFIVTTIIGVGLVVWRRL